MSYPRTKSYSRNALGQILPLDPDSLNEIIDYALSLDLNPAIESHLMDILGTSDDLLKFISQFLKLKGEDEADAKSKRQNKPKVVIPPPDAKKKPAWGAPSQKPSSVRNKGRLEHKKTATNTSQLLDIKPKSELTGPQAKKGKKKNLDNLRDVEAALNDLELAEAQTVANRKCNCMGQRHPLFEVVPNCINCGKIICAKEGLQPCLFCGHQLLSASDRDQIKLILIQERLHLEENRERLDQRQGSLSPSPVPLPAPVAKKKKVTVRLSAGKFWDEQTEALAALEEEQKRQRLQKIEDAKHQEEVKQQEEELKKYEEQKRLADNYDNDLVVAQQRLETLLDFQATGAERTKIIDRAADFDIPTLSLTMWLLPVERALQLKRQQKQLRKQDNINDSTKGRGKRVMEMVIVGGKAQMVENVTFLKLDDEADDGGIADLESEINEIKRSEEEVHLKQVWDYEGDRDRWERPVYVGMVREGDSVKGVSRLQVEGKGEEELVAAIPS